MGCDMKYTAEQIKNIGGQRFLKKRAKRIGLLLLLSIGWIFLVNWLMQKPSIIIMVAPIALVVINIVWGYFQSRNLLWERYKKDPTILE
jgi:putative flippase GtrA